MEEEVETEKVLFRKESVCSPSNHAKEQTHNVLSYSDFLMATFDLKQLSKTELWTVFKHLDTENKGKLTYRSLLKAFKRTSRGKYCEREALALMEELNMEKEDEITFEKFVQAITSSGSVNNSIMMSPKK